jgi:hypothetical protein
VFGALIAILFFQVGIKVRPETAAAAAAATQWWFSKWQMLQ